MTESTSLDSTSLADTWARLEAWLDVHAPHLGASLQPGATPREIAALEAQIGMRLPDDVAVSWLRHDGQADDAANGLLPPAPGRFAWMEIPQVLLSLEGIEREWRMMKELVDGGEFKGKTSEPETGIRDDWWNVGWVLLSTDGGGNSFCLDLSPTSQGTVGQIIEFKHDGKARRLLAPSFPAWLGQLADDLEAGVYALDNEGDLVRAAEVP